MRLFQRIRLQVFETDEFEGRRVRGFEINRSRAVSFKRGFPARNANAPFVARFQSRESPFRNWRNQIVAVEHGKIQKLLRYFYANRVQTNVFGSSPTKAVAKKSGQRIAATTFQFLS